MINGFLLSCIIICGGIVVEVAAGTVFTGLKNKAGMLENCSSCHIMSTVMFFLTSTI